MNFKMLITIINGAGIDRTHLESDMIDATKLPIWARILLNGGTDIEPKRDDALRFSELTIQESQSRESAVMLQLEVA